MPLHVVTGCPLCPPIPDLSPLAPTVSPVHTHTPLEKNLEWLVWIAISMYPFRDMEAKTGVWWSETPGPCPFALNQDLWPSLLVPKTLPELLAYFFPSRLLEITSCSMKQQPWVNCQVTTYVGPLSPWARIFGTGFKSQLCNYKCLFKHSLPWFSSVKKEWIKLSVSCKSMVKLNWCP